MSDIQFVKQKRWEGKPLSFKFKFMTANYPELAFASLIIFGVAPLVALYRAYTFENSRNDTIKKFKFRYTVIRDDHPDIEKIKAEKEAGKQFFPKY